MAEEYKYGDLIPEEYRNRLFEWRGGGYDGCFWEMNQGLVDKDGHWYPLYSTGRDGIDCFEWYERKIQDLKNEAGYDVRPARVNHEERVHNAVEKVFGKKWYELDGTPEEDPRVKKITEKDDANYEEFCRRCDEYKEELVHRHDSMFMDAFNREYENERPSEIGLLDDEHIKDTCRIFCERYSCNVGMMTSCLDKMARMGYDVWCTCSDCGEQFQAYDFENLSCSVDPDAYTGDGGIGVIMKRVLCDECRISSECPSCYGLDLPNERLKGRDPWESYGFLACLIHDWLEVCWCCTDGYERECLSTWNEACRRMEDTELGRKFHSLEEKAKEFYEEENGHELYEKMLKTPGGKKRINAMRALLEDSARGYFGDRSHFDGHEECFEYRLNTDLPGQMMLPGIE